MAHFQATRFRSSVLPTSQTGEKRFTYTLIFSCSEILIAVLEFKKISYAAVEELVVHR